MRALIVATVAGFLAAFERQDIGILRSMGYEVHCAADLAQNVGPDTLDLLRDAGAVLHDVPFDRSPFSRRDLEAYRTLRRLMDRERFDLVHCHTPVGGVLGRIAAHRAGVPTVIYTAHGFHFYDGAPLRNWILYYPVEKALSRWTDVLVTINAEDHQRARDRFHAGKVCYVPGVGVDTERFRPRPGDRAAVRAALGIPPGAFHIVTAGELNRNKDQSIVIRAVAELDDPGVWYSLCGEGPEGPALRELIRSLGLEGRVRLLGRRGDMEDVLQSADLFAFPSHREGLGIAAIEALACGVPVAAADNRGSREYMRDGSNGIVCREDSPAAFRDAIARLRADPALRARMGANARQDALAFRLERVEEIMETEVYAGPWARPRRGTGPVERGERPGW